MSASTRVLAVMAAVLVLPLALFGNVICQRDADGGPAAPLAVDDVVYVSQVNVPVRVNVLANDVVAPTGSLSIINVSIPTRGSAVTNADNSITYTPASLGNDTFTYTIVDSTQPGSSSSMATVTVVPQSGFDIGIDCHGGDCLFQAKPPSLDGIRSFTWTFGDGTPPSVGSIYAFHQFLQEGLFTVTAHADFYSGNSAEGTVGVHIVLQHAVVWTATVTGLGVSVAVDSDSIKTFAGGLESAQLHLTLGDNPADCLYDYCSTGVGFSCFPYCPESIGGAYYRSGTYPVRLSVRDANNVTYNYAKYVTAVNTPPKPAFTVTRDDPSAWSYTFDPSTSWDDFDIHSDPPFAPTPYEWDFGDGTTAVISLPNTISHLYPHAGQYTTTLRLTDAGGLSGYVSQVVNVVNAPPVPKISVNCKLLDCTFSGAGTVDDGNDVRTYEWTFGDNTTDTGVSVSKHYAAGCYVVSLKATDGQGAAATVTQAVTVGPTIFATAGGAVVDAHVQSYVASSKPATSNGNLNGILEPGETVVVEPNWHAAASTTPVSTLAGNLTTTDRVYANPSFQDYPGSYDLSTGTSDCWSTGRCYVIQLQTSATGRGANPHNDISFQETDVSTGLPTPGSPITIHVGNSFTDVPTSHWAYAYIESVLHAGVAGACNALTYCPNTVLSRGQAAQWLVLAKYGPAFVPPACSTAPFNDVPCTNANANWIAQLKADGIATPDANGNYRPDANLTRADMSILLLRTKLGTSYVPPACQFDYGDAPCPQYPAASWISDLKRRNISTGCAVNEFCPDDPVDRAQAASFVTRTFGLNLAATECPTPSYDIIPGHQPKPPIVSLAFSPSPVLIGTQSTGTLTLGYATPGGVNVPLTIDNPAAVTIPSGVFVPPGLFSATFIATPANVSQRTQTNVTATYQGQSLTTRLDVCTPAPAISSQPTPVTIYNTQSTTLSVAASGGGTLTYQWYLGTAPSTAAPIGTNSPTLNVLPSVTTSYWVNVSNACGSTPSTTVTVTVCNIPYISTQPASDVVVPGSTATLSVTAGGSGPFSYQWYEGTSGTTATPAGSNSSTFQTPILNATKSYWVRVTSTCNGPAPVDSATATITVTTQITRRQLAANTANSQSSVTTNWARPTEAGSLLVAVFSASDVSLPGAFTAPPGWQLAASNQRSNISTSIYFYPNNPGGRLSESFSSVNYPDLTLQLIEYTGVSASPLDRTQSDGDTAPRSGLASTGYTSATAQPKELLVTALTTYDKNSFTNPTDSFVKVDEQSVLFHLTTAVHELIVSTTGGYGHSASVGGTAQWLGLIATFKSADSCTAGPTITAQPASTTINAGQSATLSVTAAGSGLSYQWYQGTAPSTTTPVGTNSASLTVSPAATTSYWVNVTNSCGPTASSTAVVTICAPPVISAQPASSTTPSGSPVTLSVTATGTGPFTYQWYQGTAPSTTTPVGANSSSLTVSPAATTSYWVKVSNGCGNATSSTATVTVVCTPLSIVTQPASQTISSGSSATLTVTAGGGGPFSYQWYDGASGTTTTPVGTNSSTFTTPALSANKSYWVRVTSTCSGTATLDSNTATITVSTQITRRQLAGNTSNSTTAITTAWTQPTQAGSLLVAIISASDVAVPGAFTAPPGWQLAVTNSWSNVATSIYYYANNPGGRTSETFSSVNYPDLTLDLAEYTGVAAMTPLDRTASDADSAPRSGLASSGTTAATTQPKELVLTALTTYAQSTFTSPTNSFVKIDERNVLFHLTTAVHERIVSTAGPYGHSASVGGTAQWIGLVATFKSTLCNPPVITAQPQSQTIASGSSATLSVTAGGDGPLNYQWYQGAAPSTTTPVGTNSNSLTVTPSATTSYWVNVTSACSTAASVTATVTICVPPSVVTQPASQTVASGTAATLTVTASGSSPLTYQWYQGAAPSTTTPVGTNSSSLTITPAATTSYWVKVTNACGTASSNTVTVTVCAPPGIATQPISQTINSGSSATLSVTAGGSGPFTYQWYQGAAPSTTTPVGTNSSSLTVTPAATTSYWVRVSNSCGPTASSTATVTVCSPPGITTQPASQNISSGSTATLSVTAGGSGPFAYQWYEGASGTTTTPAGTNSSSFVTPALTATKSYWVRVTSTCNGTVAVNSNTATITVTVSQITRRQLAANTTNSTGTVTASWTQATQAGSLLVAVVSASDVSLPGPFTAPGGWQLAANNGWANVNTSIYYYPNNPGGRTSETFSIAHFPDLTLQLIEYTGVMAASPLDRTALDGDNAPRSGVASSGTTAATTQSKELVITALTTYAQSTFTSPTNSFVKIDERGVLFHLTTAVHERIVTAAGAYGHTASVGGAAQWVGLTVTFKSADTSAMLAQPPSVLYASLEGVR